MTTPAVDALMVTLGHDGHLALVLLLARDGEVRRMGSIPMQPDESGLYVGTTDRPLLDEALEALPVAFFDTLGHFSQPHQAGVPMTLTVALRTDDGEEHPFILEYGSDSPGPPQDLVAFVLKALEVTQDWYDGQRGAAG